MISYQDMGFFMGIFINLHVPDNVQMNFIFCWGHLLYGEAV